jgi:hypothetical protein
MKPSQTASILVLVALAGCAPAAAPIASGSDLSNPKAAALAFFKAIARGDVATADAASIGGEQDKKWTRAIIALIGGLKTYSDALGSRFGRQAASAQIDLHQAIVTLAQEPVMRLEGGIVHEADETAEVDPGLNGMRLTARAPVYLRKVNGAWKVDLAAMAQDPQHDPSTTARYLAGGVAMQKAARDITAGRYRTFDEAQQALAEGSMETHADRYRVLP